MQRYRYQGKALASILLLAAVAGCAPPKSAEHAAIVGTALDYIDGYYEGDVARLERALHPELAKRGFERDEATGKRVLEPLSAAELIEITRRRGQRDTAKETKQHDVTVLDVYENAASAKVVATHWIDYLHLAKIDGHWRIVNVLWEPKPGER
jgi:hypothetical protein